MKKLILATGLMGFALPLFAAGIGSVHPTDINAFIQTHSPLIYLAVFFGLGIFLAFTPCVLPMVPILSGIITGQSSANSADKNRALALSLAYVLGMALTYAIAGMLAAYFGSTVQTLMQQPLIIASFSGLFILMALWLLDIFKFRLPSFLQHHRATTQPKQRGVASAAIMGSLSTLVVSPCVTAPLIGVLTYIAQSGQVLQGGLVLFVLALGMGLPLLLVGAGYGKLLPRSGPWMILIKQLFAVLMLAMAIWLLGRILPVFWLSLLWAGFLVITAVIVGTKSHGPLVFTRILQGLAITALMSAGALTYKSIWADTETTQATTVFAPFQLVNSLDEVNQEIAKAKANHQRVFMEFFASWCSDCQGMDKHVFNQLEVINAMNGSVNLRVNISDKNETVAEIKKAYGIYGIPTMVFYDSEGQQVNELTSVGPISKDQMLQLLNQSKTK